MPNWWAEFFWSRVNKVKAAFHRGFALGFLFALILVSAITNLSGCAVIDSHVKVEGWPDLKIVEHYVPHAEMRERCGRYTSAVMSPEGCAEFDFQTARCDIWYSSDFPLPVYVMEHERLHCAGYDHIGGTAMRDMLKR